MDQHQACMTLEHFVQQALRLQGSGLETLTPLLPLIPQAVLASRVLQEHYALHRSLAVFFRALRFYRMDLKQSLCFPPDRLEALVRDIHTQYQLTTRWASDEAWRDEQRFQEIQKYLGWVLHRYARTLLVRVDLHYQANPHSPVTVERLIRDKNRFLQGIQNNALFEHCDISGYWNRERLRAFTSTPCFAFEGIASKVITTRLMRLGVTGTA